MVEKMARHLLVWSVRKNQREENTKPETKDIRKARKISFLPREIQAAGSQQCP